MLWRFRRVEKGYWNDQENRIKFMDWLGKQMGFKTMEDWYEVSGLDVADHGGDVLLAKYYHRSIIKALQAVYPDYPWEVWQFEKISNGFCSLGSRIPRLTSHLIFASRFF